MSNEQEIHILNTSETPSLSGKSTLTYQIGSDNDNNVYISLTGNSGSGIFNKDWFDIEEIYSLLAKQEKPVTSGSLHGLFEGRSSNTAGFLTALLSDLGILKVSAGNKHYNLVSQAEFGTIVQALHDTAPEGNPDKKKTGKKGKGVTND